MQFYVSTTVFRETLGIMQAACVANPVTTNTVAATNSGNSDAGTTGTDLPAAIAECIAAAESWEQDMPPGWEQACDDDGEYGT